MPLGDNEPAEALSTISSLDYGVVAGGTFKAVFDFKKTADEDETGKFLGFIEGFASTDGLDRELDIMTSDALKMGAKQLAKTDPVFFNHRAHELPVGKLMISKFRVDPGAIFVKVGVSKNFPNLWQSIEEGSLTKFSIMGRFGEIEWEDRTIKGKKKSVRLIKTVDLFELSIVGVPANMGASFSQIVAKYFDLSSLGDSPTTKVEKTMVEAETETESTEVVDEIEIEDPVDTSSSESLEKLQNDVAGLTEAVVKMVEVQKAMLVAQAQPKPGTTVRKTEVRSDPAPAEDEFKTTREYEIYEIEKFANLLLDPDAVLMDLYGTLVKKPAAGHTGLLIGR